MFKMNGERELITSQGNIFKQYWADLSKQIERTYKDYLAISPRDFSYTFDDAWMIA